MDEHEVAGIGRRQETHVVVRDQLDRRPDDVAGAVARSDEGVGCTPHVEALGAGRRHGEQPRRRQVLSTQRTSVSAWGEGR